MRRLLELGYGLYAAVVVAIGIVLTFPFLVLLPTLMLRRAAGRWGVKLVMLACFAPIRVRGLEHLPPGPCIVVSNHASYLDGPFMTAALPTRFTFIVQHGASDWPVIGPIIKRMGVTFVNRSSARDGANRTREMIRRLEQGTSVTIFPEGTFAPAPGLLPFRKGAFLMAAHAGVPVVPAAIRGTRKMLGEHQRLLRWHPIEIEFFAPLLPQGDHRHAVDALMQESRRIVLAHCGEPDAGGRVDG